MKFYPNNMVIFMAGEKGYYSLISLFFVLPVIIAIINPKKMKLHWKWLTKVD